MNSHLETSKEFNKVVNNKLYEQKICCTNCYRNCELTLLMEDSSVLCVEGDGCRKGKIFAYKEVGKTKVS